jgi:hypothetical protein
MPPSSTRRLRCLTHHVESRRPPTPAAMMHAAAETDGYAALADLDVPGIVERFQRDGFVVVKSFLHGPLLQRYRAALDSYVADVIPTKSTDEIFFDGEWSVDGGRGPTSALKYINVMMETPFFAAFR